MLPGPRVTSLGESVAPEEGHLTEDVVEVSDLVAERIEAVLVGEEHGGEPPG
jgi:hypothetical protein